MIYDVFDGCAGYYPLHPLFETVFTYIANHDLSALPSGRFELDHGVFGIASEYETALASQKFIEFHELYIDLQMVTAGSEKVGVVPRSWCRVLESYNKEKDFGKLEGDLDFVRLVPGVFMILFPEDGHMPGVVFEEEPTLVKKIVFKIPVH